MATTPHTMSFQTRENVFIENFRHQNQTQRPYFVENFFCLQQDNYAEQAQITGLSHSFFFVIKLKIEKTKNNKMSLKEKKNNNIVNSTEIRFAVSCRAKF